MPGPAGRIDTYAYIYTNRPLCDDAFVPFHYTGSISGCIGFQPCAQEVVLGDSGDYAIWFYVAPGEADCAALYLNGKPVDGGLYAGGGMVILRAKACDKLSLKVQKHCGCKTDCGCLAVTASLLIMRFHYLDNCRPCDCDCDCDYECDCRPCDYDCDYDCRPCDCCDCDCDCRPCDCCDCDCNSSDDKDCNDSYDEHCKPDREA